jgi:hypothetical protein
MVDVEVFQAFIQLRAIQFLTHLGRYLLEFIEIDKATVVKIKGVKDFAHDLLKGCILIIQLGNHNFDEA